MPLATTHLFFIKLLFILKTKSELPRGQSGPYSIPAPCAPNPNQAKSVHKMPLIPNFQLVKLTPPKPAYACIALLLLHPLSRSRISVLIYRFVGRTNSARRLDVSF